MNTNVIHAGIKQPKGLAYGCETAMSPNVRIAGCGLCSWPEYHASEWSAPKGRTYTNLRAHRVMLTLWIQ